jgi:hypothetical protein
LSSTRSVIRPKMIGSLAVTAFNDVAATRYPARAQAGHGHGAATVGLLARDAAWR